MSQTASLPGQPVTAEQFPVLLQMITGYWVSQCLYVVAKLGIADLVKEQPSSIESLAGQTHTDPDYLYRVMRALMRVGVFHEVGEKQFIHTPLSILLKTTEGGSLRDFAIMMGEEHYHAWGNLLNGVQTGGRPFEITYHMPVFEFFHKHPESGETFNRSMTAFATTVHQAVTAVYDFSQFQTLVDVGGGHGGLLTAILSKYPNLNGVLFDLSHVISGASVPATLTSRFRAVAGDFFQAIHPGGDAYILSTVIHDWSDDLAVKILSKLHAAMPAHGKLLLVEHVVEPPDAETKSAMPELLDINMLVMTEGGRERTRAEFEALYRKAGFALQQVIPTPLGVCIIEGVKQ